MTTHNRITILPSQHVTNDSKTVSYFFKCGEIHWMIDIVSVSWQQCTINWTKERFALHHNSTHITANKLNTWSLCHTWQITPLHTLYQLANVATAMQSNLRLPDIAPVILHFNYEAHNALVYQISTQLGNVQLSYWWFSKFSLKEIFNAIDVEICTAHVQKLLFLNSDDDLGQRDPAQDQDQDFSYKGQYESKTLIKKLPLLHLRY